MEMVRATADRTEKGYLSGLKERFDKLEDSAPVVPEDIYERLEAKYKGAKFSANVRDFLAAVSEQDFNDKPAQSATLSVQRD
jgi:hypothetical protein